MIKLAVTATVAALALAGCGSSGSHHTYQFRNRAVFEAYVAGTLGVSSVSCTKTGSTTASCTDSEGSRIVVLCESADESGGHNCFVQYAEDQ